MEDAYIETMTDMSWRARGVALNRTQGAVKNRLYVLHRQRKVKDG